MDVKQVYESVERYNKALQDLADFALSCKITKEYDIPRIEAINAFHYKWKSKVREVELMEIKLYEDSTLFNEEWVRAKLEEEKNNGR